MLIYLKNQLRGYSVIIPTLQALSKDICRRCIGLEGAKTKVIKGLKKLRIDLENSILSEGEKGEIATSIERLSDMAEGIYVVEETACQKTTGNCNIGPACLALDGALGLMKQITEPVSAAPEVVVSKVVDVRAACCPNTLAAPIKDMMKSMNSDDVLEVIIVQGLKDIFNKFVEQEKFTIIEETVKGENVHFKISLR